MLNLHLVDAATGDALLIMQLPWRFVKEQITYPVTVLKEIAVEASANGKCAIEELPIGSYTIQVVSADAKV